MRFLEAHRPDAESQVQPFVAALAEPPVRELVCARHRDLPQTAGMDGVVFDERGQPVGRAESRLRIHRHAGARQSVARPGICMGRDRRFLDLSCGCGRLESRALRLDDGLCASVHRVRWRDRLCVRRGNGVRSACDSDIHDARCVRQDLGRRYIAGDDSRGDRLCGDGRPADAQPSRRGGVSRYLSGRMPVRRCAELDRLAHSSVRHEPRFAACRVSASG